VLRKLAFAGVLGFAFVVPWEDAVVIPGFGTIGRASGFLLMAVALPQFIERGRLVMRSPSVAAAALGGFALWGSATLLWTVDSMATARAVTTLVQLVVMFTLIWQLCETDARRRAAMQAYVLGGFVAVADALVNYVTGQEAAFRRFAATGFDPNDFAAILALGIPMAWQLARGARLWLAILNLAYLPAALIAILLSASRGGAIAAGVAMLVVVFGLPTMDRATRRAAIVVGAALLVVLPLIVPVIGALAESSIYRFGSIARGLGEGSLNERGVIWRSGFEAFPENPIRGAGLGAFAAVIERTGLGAEVAHNSFLSVFVETGVVGALLFAAVLLAVLLPLLRAPRRIALPDLVLFLTLMVVMIPLSWELRKPTWFVLAMLAASHGAQLVAGYPRAGRRGKPYVGAIVGADIGAGHGGR